MAVTVKQTWEGYKVLSADNSSISSEYVIQGTNDEFVAEAALIAAVTLNLGGLIKKSTSIDERLGENAWRGRVVWGQLEPNEAGDSQFSFDTSGGTAHITHSRETISKTAPAGEVAPDFDGAIGVTEDGVEGTDVVVPAYSFSETHFLDASVVTEAYKQTLFLLTGSVSAAPYKGLAAGECQFVGSQGTLKDWQTWEIQFNFVCSANAQDLAVGASIVVPSKLGFDYLWVRYQEVEDETAGRLVRRPIAAYVERVSPFGDLSLLGIGI